MHICDMKHMIIERTCNMTQQCRCPNPHHSPSPLGTSLGNGVVADWQPLPGTNAGKPSDGPRNCSCGCNVYIPASDMRGVPGPYSEFPSDIPVLPLALEYEDDDEPSDDHEYISIRATDFADILARLRSCSCRNAE